MNNAHADLVGDVVPVKLAAKVFDEQVFELSTHAVDAVGHLLDLFEPVFRLQSVAEVSY